MLDLKGDNYFTCDESDQEHDISLDSDGVDTLLKETARGS